MTHLHEIDHSYDAIIVGARVAGAATAMLMARRGMKVLAIDRLDYGSDTMSTHALMRGAVVQLSRWGLLDRIAATTPAVSATEFHYGEQCFRVEMKPEYGVDALYAPRRTVLDRILADAAAEAGADVRFSTSFLELNRGIGGEIAGVTLKQGTNPPKFVRAPLVIGADGRASWVAEQVGSTIEKQGKHATSVTYGYFAGLPDRGYRWYYDHGVSAGIIPTNDGNSCVFASTKPKRFKDEVKFGKDTLFNGILSDISQGLAEELASAKPVAPLRGFPGIRGFMRASGGKGWALVGDAGYFKDPATAHGITDALRDAELVAEAALHGNDIAKSEYQIRRDAMSRDFFDITDRIASFEWDMPGVQALHKDLNRTMKAASSQMFDVRARAA